MTLRNLILIVALSLFLLGYVAYWAYHSLYLEPRQELGDEIAKLTEEIEGGQNRLASMKQFCENNVWFYSRSLPQVPNDARSQYQFWLLELLQYSGLENNHVEVASPAATQYWGDYRGTIQCTGTLSQLSHFLFEFYYVPFLHRITSIRLDPVEGNPDKKTFTIVVNALGLRPRDRKDPYPLANQLPSGEGWYIQRMAYNDLSAYQVIENRDLLQTAKGGIDRADYTFLTGIVQFNDQTEVWFSVRTDDSSIRAKLGDTINSGSFSGRIVEIYDQDIVLDRNGSRWLLSIGESLLESFALPPETEQR